MLAVMPFRGIFLNEGNIRIWLTNDRYRIPLMMKAKVVIGAIVARLQHEPHETKLVFPIYVAPLS